MLYDAVVPCEPNIIPLTVRVYTPLQAVPVFPCNPGSAFVADQAVLMSFIFPFNTRWIFTDLLNEQ